MGRNLIKNLYKKNKIIVPPPKGGSMETPNRQEGNKDTPMSKFLRSMTKNSSFKLPQNVLNKYPLDRKKKENTESSTSQPPSYEESTETKQKTSQEENKEN